MKKVLLVLFAICTGIAYSQNKNETNSDSLPFDNQLFNPSNSQHSNPFLLSTPSLYGSSHDNLRLMDLQHDSRSVHFPTITKNTFTAPFIPDGNLYQKISINSHNWINTTRIQEEFIGLGGMRLSAANYNWKIADNLIVSPGIFASKYNVYNNFRNDVGVNGKIKFVFSDHISMNLFGQYSFYGKKNSVIPLMTSLYPQTNFGGSFEYKVNDNWGVLVGADREFDFRLEKWIFKPFIMPFFYKF